MEGNFEIEGAEGTHHGLEVVLASARDAQLIALDLGLGFHPEIFDVFDQFFGVFLLDALDEFENLSHRAPGGWFDRSVGERFEREPAFHQFGLEDVGDLCEFKFVVADEFDGLLFFVDGNLAFAPAEIEPLADFLGRLVDRVFQLLFVHFGDDVKGKFFSHDGGEYSTIMKVLYRF